MASIMDQLSWIQIRQCTHASELVWFLFLSRLQLNAGSQALDLGGSLVSQLPAGLIFLFLEKKTRVHSDSEWDHVCA